MSLNLKDAAGTSAEEEEEEEEFFEIDLEAVSEIPQPLYWESYDVTPAITDNNNVNSSSNNTLLANCLLPVVQVSSAVPSGNSTTANAFIPWPPTLLVAEDFMGAVFPSLHFFASQYNKTKLSSLKW